MRDTISFFTRPSMGFAAALCLTATALPSQTLDLSITDPDQIAAECGGTAAEGALLFQDCAACHALSAEESDGLAGPHLGSLFGREVASVEGYAYGPGLTLRGVSGAIWERETLHAFLSDPQSSPGHPVVGDEQARRDILTYLRTATLPPPPEPGTLDIPEEVFALAGDPAYGEYLGSECAGCHSSGAGNVPQIEGMDRRYFITVLHEYRARARPNETMQLLTARLSDEEIAALAAYFTSE